MDIKELDKSTMDSVKNLAEMNIKISDAKTALSKLKELETEYIEAREKKTLAKIDEILDESKELTKQIQSNHTKIKTFTQNISTFSAFMLEAHQDFSKLLDNFEEEQKGWEVKIKEREKDLEEEKKNILIQKNQIANDTKTLENKFKELEKERKKIEDLKGIIDRKIIRFKQGKI